VVQRVHEHRKSVAPGGHISYASYAKPILQSIRSYAYPEIHVTCADAAEGEGAKEEFAVRWAFVCNLSLYGWGVPLAPGADGSDGLLDLCTFSGGSLWHGLKYAAMIQVGRHARLADFRHRRGSKFRIFSECPVPYQMDGDPGGRLPVEVEVLPGRVTLVVPEKR
jgi:diacylglycerol kinase family enzyme